MQTVVSVGNAATLKAIHMLQIHSGLAGGWGVGWGVGGGKGRHVWVSPCQEANAAFLGTSLLP